MAKKKSSYPRTSISLSAELQKRMRACGGKVNWSKIAAEAFSAELERISGPVSTDAVASVPHYIRVDVFLHKEREACKE